MLSLSRKNEAACLQKLIASQIFHCACVARSYDISLFFSFAYRNIAKLISFSLWESQTRSHCFTIVIIDSLRFSKIPKRSTRVSVAYYYVKMDYFISSCTATDTERSHNRIVKGCERLA